MRLWSIHPKYLDTKGLVALWREGLLVQAVLMGKTKGWKNHPQLDRFKTHKQQIIAMTAYLNTIWNESKIRGYKFNQTKIHRPFSVYNLSSFIIVSKEWIDDEIKALKSKLRKRCPGKYRQLLKTKDIELHPLFKIG